jgi:hypothetical protein
MQLKDIRTKNQEQRTKNKELSSLSNWDVGAPTPTTNKLTLKHSAKAGQSTKNQESRHFLYINSLRNSKCTL